MGKRKNKDISALPDTYIEADPEEAHEEAQKSGPDVPESAVGKKLASADKKVRDKAVLVLGKWLSKQATLGEEDHMKIWKALYYCFWMSDKPLVQNELAEKISEFIHAFPVLEQAVIFARTFFKTMDREWPGIDKFRMNKFYYLVRCLQRESLIYMAKSNWDEEVVGALNNVLSEGPLSLQAKCTDLKLHLADIFLDELANSGAFESGFSDETLLILLGPYIDMIVTAKDKSVFERGYSRILQSLAGERWLSACLQESDDIDPARLQPMRHTNRMFRHTYIEPIPMRDICQLCLDREFASNTSLKITQRIFSLTVKKSTPEFVRKRFYDLLEEYSELCDNLGKPFQEDIDAVSDEGDVAEDDEQDEEAETEVEEEEEAEESAVARPSRGKKGQQVQREKKGSKVKKREKKEGKTGHKDAFEDKRKEKRARILEEREEPAIDHNCAHTSNKNKKSTAERRSEAASVSVGAPGPGHKGAAKAAAKSLVKASGEAGAAQPRRPAPVALAGRDSDEEPGLDAPRAARAEGKKRRQPEASDSGTAAARGGSALTVEERRGVRSRVTSLAATQMADSALTAAPTMSPRKHALTAADFFLSEVDRAAAAERPPPAETRPHKPAAAANKAPGKAAKAAHREKMHGAGAGRRTK